LKKHEAWSDFSKFDDVVPLFEKERTLEQSSNPRIHRVKAQNSGLWSCILLAAQLICLCAWNYSLSVYHGLLRIKEFGRIGIRRLRFHSSNDELQKDSDSISREDNLNSETKSSMNSDFVGGSLSENAAIQTPSSSGSLKRFFRVNYSPERMATLQQQDPDISVVAKWFKSDRKRPLRDIVAGYSPSVRNMWLHWDLLTLIDGVLFKRHILKNNEECLQLVVPGVLRKEVLLSGHDSNTGGHLGVDKTYSKLKMKFYWYKMKESVKRHIRTCEKCCKRKRPAKTPRSPMTEYTVGFPMDRLSTDIMGPLPITESGNKYCLVVIDNFTKWAEAYAIKDQLASTVAHKIVYEFLSRFGVSLDIYSDQGSNYQSKLFREVCRPLQINQTRTSGYRGMANGAPERFNQVLQNMISTYVDSNQTNWDEDLNLITSAYRTCVHDGTGFSPNMLMLGREVILPIEISLGCIPHKNQSGDANDYVCELQDRLCKIYEIARQTLRKTANVQKRDYDTRISQNTYKDGDLVLCLNKANVKGISKKIMPNIWDGPFQAKRKISDLLFEIFKGNNSKSKIVHHDRLKPFLGSTLPDWSLKQGSVLPLSTKAKTSNKKLSVNDNKFVPRRSGRQRVQYKPYQY
jgi:hypothetical protein